MKLIPRDVFVSILMISVSAATLGAEPSAKALSFAWPDMTCAVKQRLEQSSSGKPIESRYTMTAKQTGENLRVSFLEFQVIDTFPEVPLRAREQYLAAEYAIGRSTVERSYEVSPLGKFVRAESPADVEKRIKASGKPQLHLFTNQQTLDAKYLLGWQNFIGNWIGLKASPGATVQITIKREEDEFWLTYDVPTDITVSAPIDCPRSGKILRCVIVRTHFMPAFKKAGESEENSMRHEDTSEIVLEPETMIPHSWMEEIKYRGGLLDGKLESRYTRTFECSAGG
jgi:hypothetical protein